MDTREHITLFHQNYILQLEETSIPPSVFLLNIHEPKKSTLCSTGFTSMYIH